MTKRMVSAHAYPGETKADILNAVAKRRSHDVMVTDPLVLGSGAFDIQDLDDTLRLKLTDSTRRKWMIFIERENDRIVVHGEEE